MKTPLRLLPFVLAALAVCGADMRPYAMEWRPATGAAVDLSFLLPRPAGKSGFVRVANGHLVTGNGKRFRIWGVNFTAASTTPAKEDAPLVAEHLARFGINCVRFHFLDSRSPAGLVASNRDDSQVFDPAQLDRLDFFIAQLARRGVYTNLNLNVGRMYRAGDGVRDFELLGFAKALTYFDERLLELQRQYARQLLTHRNPYTGHEYRREPAVAIVELVNENSIVESWVSNRLLGKAGRKNPGTWTDIPESYERDLTAKYHAWLKTKGLPPEPRLRREEFEKAPKERFLREAGFYMEMERDYFSAMNRFLKDEVGVKSLVVGTSDHNHGISGYPLLSSTSQLDVVDGHVYWQHPRYTTDPATGRQTGFDIPNTPMVKDPLHSTVVELSRSAVAGKPYTVSEVNHPAPAEHAAEGIPILGAYAAFQDWDGIFWYTFEHKPPSQWEPAQPRHFEIRPDPVKMSQIAAGALTFLRGDIRPAAMTATRGYTPDQVRESLRMNRNERPYFTPGFPLSLPLTHAVRIDGFDRASGGPYDSAMAGTIRSDTGELEWRGSPGVVKIDTGRSQVLAGFVREGQAATRNLAPAVENQFCAITLESLDSKPIAMAAKLLLTAGARVANTGMEWNDRRTTLLQWGTKPTVIEQVVGTISLRGIDRASGVEVKPLDGAGRAIATVKARKSPGAWEFPIGETTSVWWLIEVKR